MLVLPSYTQLAFTYSKLTIETLEQRCEICSKLKVNFEHISHLCSNVSIVNFEHVIAGWVILVVEMLKTNLLDTFNSFMTEAVII